MGTVYPSPAPRTPAPVILFPRSQEEGGRTVEDYDRDWRQRGPLGSDPYVMIPVEVLRNGELSAWARLVYGALLMHRNRKTGRCDPSRRTIARALGCSVPTVARCLAELETVGEIVRHEVMGRTTQYEITRITGDTGVESESPDPYHGRDGTRITGDTPPVSPVIHKPEEKNQTKRTTPSEPPASRLLELFNGRFPKVSADFTAMDDALSATWLQGVLAEADPLAPEIGWDALKEALRSAKRQYERAASNPKPEFRPNNPKGWLRKVIVEAIAERAGVPS